MLAGDLCARCSWVLEVHLSWWWEAQSNSFSRRYIRARRQSSSKIGMRLGRRLWRRYPSVISLVIMIQEFNKTDSILNALTSFEIISPSSGSSSSLHTVKKPDCVFRGIWDSLPEFSELNNLNHDCQEPRGVISGTARSMRPIASNMTQVSLEEDRRLTCFRLNCIIDWLKGCFRLKWIPSLCLGPFNLLWLPPKFL